MAKNTNVTALFVMVALLAAGAGAITSAIVTPLWMGTLTVTKPTEAAIPRNRVPVAANPNDGLLSRIASLERKLAAHREAIEAAADIMQVEAEYQQQLWESINLPGVPVRVSAADLSGDIKARLDD